jgi:hypothetical protein
MHEPIEEGLERHLLGEKDRTSLRAFDAHLENCEECRSEVRELTLHSQLLKVLRPPADIEPSAGFYARVVNRIETQAKPSFWNLLLDPTFGRRLVYATLTAVLLMGTYMISTEPGDSVELAQQPPTPEAILAAPETPPALGENPERDRDAILVSLTTYRE